MSVDQPFTMDESGQERAKAAQNVVDGLLRRGFRYAYFNPASGMYRGLRLLREASPGIKSSCYCLSDRKEKGEEELSDKDDLSFRMAQALLNNITLTEQPS